MGTKIVRIAFILIFLTAGYMIFADGSIKINSIKLSSDEGTSMWFDDEQDNFYMQFKTSNVNHKVVLEITYDDNMMMEFKSSSEDMGHFLTNYGEAGRYEISFNSRALHDEKGYIILELFKLDDDGEQAGESRLYTINWN